MEQISLLVGAIFLYEVLRIIAYFLYAKYIGWGVVPFSTHGNFGERERIVIFGDSTAVGVGASDPSFSVAGLIAKDHPDYDIINYAKNGINLHQLLERMDAIPRNPAKIVLIQIGGMDIFQLAPTRRVRWEASELIRRAREISDRVVILISGSNMGAVPIFRFPFQALYSLQADQVRQAIKESAQGNPGVRFIDLAEKTATPEEESLLLYAADRLHPNDKGYFRWYRMIDATIKSFSQNTKI